MNRYEGRRVLITGGGSGIGQATVLRILAEGGHVVAADVDEAGLAATRKLAAEAAEAAEAGEAGGAAGGEAEARLHTVQVDIADESSVRAAVAAALAALGGGLDVLVNAAGILRSSHTHETSLEQFTKVIAVNLTGTFLMIRETLPALAQGDAPAVINFSSTSANFAHPYMAAYAASKGGIQSMTHALAAEYGKQGIRFTAVAPGSISSGMTDASGTSAQNAGPGLPQDADLSLFAKLAPALGHGFAGPDAVAGVVAMLGSADGSFITGTEIRIDGGTHY
ncbi:SDR family NAD(P)-dependent oxidoreductase [Streptacidiphilus anmyonensis]|uniref:SDR family NAD(P)-dependent oxidoreductase n=1 Tax=Streptacidiphilus anmyonensis TaxID=405782 RepID=UPI0005A63EE5|nr:SDR family oxidoreductase [Streptacidiphilus anmyonensis]